MATYYLDPTADGKDSWTSFPTSGQTAAANTAKGTRQPTAPATTSGISDTSTSNQVGDDFTALSLAANERVISVTLWAYGSSSVAGAASIFAVAGGLNGPTVNLPTAAGWVSSAITGVALDEWPSSAQLSVGESNSANTGTNYIYSWYVVVVTELVGLGARGARQAIQRSAVR